MTERLTVVAWLWAQPGGATRYGAAHVNIWADMVRRHLTLDHEIACVTDTPEGIDSKVRIIPPPEFPSVRLPKWGPKRPQCLRRLSMYAPNAADWLQAERVVCMDLDVVVCNSLDPLLDAKDDFKITKGTATRRTYNGSMQLLRLGSRPHVYTEFTAEKAIRAGARHIGSDQAWIAAMLPGEAVWCPEDGVRFWGQHHGPGETRAIFFAGDVKPWRLAEVGADRLVSENYRRSPSGAGLILGHGETLWPDVDVALDGRFDAVIASPEAAAHWPGPVLALADDDAHAERLAAMHGLQPTFCGRGGQ